MNILNAQAVLTASMQVLSKYQNKIAVIDLDSTLYNVSKRQITIFHEFAKLEHHQKLFPEETKFLLKISGRSLAYYPVDCLKQVGLHEVHPDFSAMFHKFWSPRFFSHEYLIHDEIEPGAKEFMNKLEAAGFKIIFLTGRDVARMGEGTIKQLNRDHVLGNDRELVLKPHLSEEDHSFKLRIVKDLCSKNETGVLFIDNEANNLNHIYKANLPVYCVFFDTVHSGKADPLPAIDVMRSFVL
jgi:phosphoserine phosphatase